MRCQLAGKNFVCFLVEVFFNIPMSIFVAELIFSNKINFLSILFSENTTPGSSKVCPFKNIARFLQDLNYIVTMGR